MGSGYKCSRRTVYRGGEGRGGESMGIPAGGVSLATSRIAKIFDNGTIYIGTIKS